ncbi:MAG: hypothetical protein GX226_03510 [Dehalococcoidales bacterium]|nr:hypothetical protein [Dehalococcoidales bacterium]
MENTEKNAEQIQDDTGPAVPEENKIAILGHNIFSEDNEDGGSNLVIELNIKNVMKLTVGSVVFEAIFTDKDGNVLDAVEQKVTSLAPDVSRTVRLVYKVDATKPLENYNVQVRDMVMVPESVACGNEMVTVTKHNLKYFDNAILEGVECGIQNVSDKDIATLIMECTFFDGEGNILKVIKHKETNLLSGNSRGIMIPPPADAPAFLISSYNIRVLRAITTDVEKVQIIKDEIRTLGDAKEVTLSCKNISAEKTDAAVIVKFLNDAAEVIGIKVIPVKDLEPGSTRQFNVSFQPLPGDYVKNHEVSAGDLVE